MGEHCVDIAGVAGSIPAVPTSLMTKKVGKTSKRLPFNFFSKTQGKDFFGTNVIGLVWYITKITLQHYTSFKKTSICSFEYKNGMESRASEQDWLLEKALTAHSGKKLKRAIHAYKKVLKKGPNVAASNGLAIALRELGLFKEALSVIETGILHDPQHSVLLNTYGTILISLKHINEAISKFQAATKGAPEYAEAWANLGLAFNLLDMRLEAKSAFLKALALDPRYVRLNYELGKTLYCLGENVAAEKYFLVYLKKKPNDASALNDLGNVIFAQRRFEDARNIYHQAVKAQADFVSALNNLGSTCRRLADIDGAIDSYNAALNIDPEHAEVRCNRALTLLLAGYFEEGFTEYDWRWKTQKFNLLVNSNHPKWRGERASGLRFLCISEQGIGDTLQFSRYLPFLAERGADITFCCQPSLVRLFKPAPYLKEVISTKDKVPNHDVFSPLLDLPKHFPISNGMNADHYHLPSPDTIALPGSNIKVGIVWAGNPEHTNDAERSIDLSLFSPLFRIKGISWYSLQVGKAKSDLKQYPNIFDLSPNFNDFLDTARAITGLDIVISVDTAVAHLSASLAKPTWILLPDVSDWRWGLNDEKSCWYSSVRLFRQKIRDDWLTVVESVQRQLIFFLKSKAPQ